MRLWIFYQSFDFHENFLTLAYGIISYFVRFLNFTKIAKYVLHISYIYIYLYIIMNENLCYKCGGGICNNTTKYIQHVCTQSAC